MILKPPSNITKRDISRKSVFLAGSIEMGKAEDWQKDMEQFFDYLSYDIFNPRRDDWDSSWEQKYTSPQFAQQVNWELDALKVCDVIVMNFIADTISPISLLEFGKYSESGKMFVICPEKYWRVGNVEIVCVKDGIPMFDTLNEFKKYFLSNQIK